MNHQTHALFCTNPPCALSLNARHSTVPETDPRLLAAIALRTTLIMEPLVVTCDEILLPDKPPPPIPPEPSPVTLPDLHRIHLPALRPGRHVMFHGVRYRAAQVAAAILTEDLSFLSPYPPLALPVLGAPTFTLATMSMLRIPPVIHTPIPGYPDAHTVLLSI